MDRAGEFIQLYNRLSDHLVTLVDAEAYLTYAQLLRRAAHSSTAVAAYESDLRDYGDLRNAIIHYKNYPREVLAEPAEPTLASFRAIVDRVIAPKRLIPTFQQTVRLFAPDDPLLDALGYMEKKDYSQVAVSRDHTLALLTVEGVTSWLRRQARDAGANLDGVSLRDVLAHDSPAHLVVMARGATVYDARHAFTHAIERKQPRIYAILVTQNGKPSEKPLGIVTPWDLLEETQ